jgi:DNA-binding MarR family transcriptional regulator
VSTARHRNPVVQRGYTQIENELLFDASLSAGALRLLVALKHYAWRNDGEIPGQREVAKAIGVSERALRDHYKELEARELVTVDRKPRGNLVVLEEVTPAESSGVTPAVFAALDRQILPPHREEEKAKTSEETYGSSASAVTKKAVEDLFGAFQDEGMRAPSTKSQRSSYMKQVRECVAAGWTPQTIRSLARSYRAHETLGKTMLTIFALCKWAGQLEADGSDQGERLRRRMAERGIA